MLGNFMRAGQYHTVMSRLWYIAIQKWVTVT